MKFGSSHSIWERTEPINITVHASTQPNHPTNGSIEIALALEYHIRYLVWEAIHKRPLAKVYFVDPLLAGSLLSVPRIVGPTSLYAALDVLFIGSRPIGYD